MDPNRVEGTGRQVGGRLRAWWGRLIGRPEEQVIGKVDETIGRVQQGYGRLKDEVRAEERRQQEPNSPPPGRTL